MPTKYIDVQGCATFLHYAGATTLPDVIPDFSRGRKILLIHGAGSNGNRWRYQIEGLSAKHSPVAFDLPGHGRSAGVEGLRSVHDYADFVAGLMSALKINSAVIAGWSMGGAIAMDLALRHTDRVEALVLVATAAKFNLASDRVDSLKAIAQGRAPQAFTTDNYSQKTIKERFDLIREGWMEQIKTDPRVRYTDILACNEVDLRNDIGRIKVPTLVIAGAEDQSTPPADAQLIAAKIGGSKLTAMPDASHMVPVEKSAEVNSEIESFLASSR